MYNRRRTGRLSSSIDSRIQPINKPLTRYDIAREQLRLEEVPINLPCREKEYDQVYNKIKESIDKFSGRRIFISGQPGTGKTATVRQAIKNLKEKVCKKVSRFDNSLIIFNPKKVIYYF
jgi:origin recognition complex subunit 1